MRDLSGWYWPGTEVVERCDGGGGGGGGAHASRQTAAQTGAGAEAAALGARNKQHHQHVAGEAGCLRPCARPPLDVGLFNFSLLSLLLLLFHLDRSPTSHK